MTAVNTTDTVVILTMTHDEMLHQTNFLELRILYTIWTIFDFYDVYISKLAFITQIY